jgi:RNA-directed DNA polymerase
VGDLLVCSNVEPWPDVRDHLNSIIRRWSNYFGYGTTLMAYRAVDHYVYERVRQFLQRHKVQSRGTSRFTDATVFGKLACCVSVMWPGARPLCASW